MHDLGLREYVRILQRRKWIVLQAVIIVPLAAVAFALHQSPLYSSSADVLLRYQSLPSALSGITDPNSYSYYIDPTRSTDTQLQIADLPVLHDRVAAAMQKHGGGNPGSISVSSLSDTDILRFTATSGSANLAALTATEYAKQFTAYRRQLDTGSITSALADLTRRIDDLKAEGTTHARREASTLQAKADQLQTLLSLETSNAVVVRTASGGTKIRPKPTKYGILGIGLGLVLGLGLAFLRDAFDTRLRTTDDVAETLGVPLLARIPPPPRRVARDHKLVMLAEPNSRGGEAFRRLRMNLEFAAIGKPSQVLMAASAVEEEGKSTTIANLALAMALAGKSVALVDLDLRRPTIGSLFRVDGSHPGLSAVVLGHTTLNKALVEVPIPSLSHAPANGNGRNGDAGDWFGPNGARAGGSLVVLPAGLVPPDPGEFVALDGVKRVVASLRERVDVVLLDVPPLLPVGDGLTTAGLADALLVIVRADRARKGVTGELAKVIGGMPAKPLGFVLCGAEDFGRPPYDKYGYDVYSAKPPVERVSS